MVAKQSIKIRSEKTNYSFYRLGVWGTEQAQIISKLTLHKDGDAKKKIDNSPGKINATDCG